MKRLFIFSVLILTLLVSIPAFGADYQKGLNAVRQGNYSAALKEWKPLAEQGYADTQHNLGVIYGTGLGFPQDYAVAHMWWNIAASNSKKDIFGKPLRNSVAKKMSPAQIAEAQRMAREWVAKHQK